ncbi:MAG: hypothetical protein KKD77_22450 [Gammaproteobacteria bacterium]|nr:hypothetical protein [Gammaproteobacteria bacterium]
MTVTTMEGAYGDYGANEADVAMAAADVGNGNYWVLKEGDVLLAHNTNVGAQTITIASVADKYGRSGNIAAYSIGADEYAVFGPFQFHGWRQTTGWIHVDAASADVLLGVLRAP